MNRKLFLPVAIFAALLTTALIFPAHAQSTPDQLIEIDQQAIEWQNNSESDSAAGSGGRATGGGDGSGSGGGSGSISSYVNGGPFKPLLDESKNIGKGFRDLYEYIR